MKSVWRRFAGQTQKHLWQACQTFPRVTATVGFSFYFLQPCCLRRTEIIQVVLHLPLCLSHIFQDLYRWETRATQLTMLYKPVWIQVSLYAVTIFSVFSRKYNIRGSFVRKKIQVLIGHKTNMCKYPQASLYPEKMEGQFFHFYVFISIQDYCLNKTTALSLPYKCTVLDF